MKTLLSPYVGIAVLALSLNLPVSAAEDPGLVDFGVFEAPDKGEFVEVQIKSNLIQMVARLAEDSEPEVADLLGGLRSIRVNVVSLNDENRDSMASRMKQVRSDLEKRGWDKIVTAIDEGDDVGVYVKLRGEEAVEGVVVTVLEGKGEAVFVNVAGDVRPEKLALLGERFNIQPLKEIGVSLNKS